jgi:DMSO/TMAO reductase YedYZ molybdopterin-dependent catalytic subunit
MLYLAITFFSIISALIAPIEASSEWTLSVEGAVTNPFSLTMSELKAQPRTTIYGKIYCYGVFVIAGNWTGVNLRLLLEKAEVDQGAQSVDFYAVDGYSKDISLTDAVRDDVIIAYEMNGQPLNETLRLVVPGANGDRWVSMINKITVSTNLVSYTQSGPLTDFSPRTFGLTPAPLPSPLIQPSPTPPVSPSPQPTQPIKIPSVPSPTPSQVTATSKSDSYQSVWIMTGSILGAAATIGLAISLKKHEK